MLLFPCGPLAAGPKQAGGKAVRGPRGRRRQGGLARRGSAPSPNYRHLQPCFSRLLNRDGHRERREHGAQCASCHAHARRPTIPTGWSRELEMGFEGEIALVA
jgi:hypothetical protein